MVTLLVDSCNFALMNWRNKNPPSHFGLDISNWVVITKAGNDMMRECFKGNSESGGEIATTTGEAFP